MARKKKKKEALQIAKTTDGWYDGKRGVVIPWADLTDAHLQSALLNAERQEIYLFNRTAFFGNLVEKLMDEAEKRGLQVRHHKSQYTYNTHLKTKK